MLARPARLTLHAATAAAWLLLSAQTALAQAQAPAAAPAPATAPAAAEVTDGKIAYYGQRFAGRKTASGERFDPNAMTMAHKTLPMGTRVKVTNLATQRSVVLRVNDRGPSTPDRVADVSVAAARQLRMLRSGVTTARLEVVSAPAARAGKG